MSTSKPNVVRRGRRARRSSYRTAALRRSLIELLREASTSRRSIQCRSLDAFLLETSQDPRNVVLGHAADRKRLPNLLERQCTPKLAQGSVPSADREPFTHRTIMLDPFTGESFAGTTRLVTGRSQRLYGAGPSTNRVLDLARSGQHVRQGKREHHSNEDQSGQGGKPDQCACSNQLHEEHDY